jgi:hypothetical protein
LKSVATIVITMPVKSHDATEHTFLWAIEMEKIAKSFGYKVISLKGNDVTYDKVTTAIQKYSPRIFIHVGHGCAVSLNGNRECIVNRKYQIDELMNMDYDRLEKLMYPVKLGNSCGKEICELQDSVCLPLCFSPTNVHLLKDTIVLAVACHSSSQLGRCAVAYGATAYLGYNDLLLFPVDTMQSQDMFGDIHIQLMKNILMGNSVGEAYNKIMAMEDYYIRMYKSIKWVGLPLLFNHRHRELLGDVNATIY